MGWFSRVGCARWKIIRAGKMKRGENKGWAPTDIWPKKEIGIQIKYIFKFKQV
jgi:hypothetical protein